MKPRLINLRIASMALGVAVLFACTNVLNSPSGYGKANPIWGSPYGYSDKSIGDNEFSIVFTANPATSKERTALLALLRAAHLTREQGRTHFMTVHQQTVALEREALFAVPIGGLVVSLPVGETVTKEPTAVLVIRLLAADALIPADAIEAADVIRRVETALLEQ